MDNNNHIMYVEVQLSMDIDNNIIIILFICKLLKPCLVLLQYRVRQVQSLAGLLHACWASCVRLIRIVV